MTTIIEKLCSHLKLTAALILWASLSSVSMGVIQPKLYYDFEEQQGSTVINRGTLGGTGTIMNTPIWITGAPGISGGGYQVNGLDGSANANYIDTNFKTSELGIYDADAVAPFTLVCWAQSNKEQYTSKYLDEVIFGQIVSKYLHIGIRAQRPRLALYGDDYITTTTLTKGTWYHLVYQLTHDNVLHVFLNGVPIGSKAGVIQGINNDGNLLIGTAYSQMNLTLQGGLDDVAVYTDVLSLKQIQFLAAGGDPLNVPDHTGGEFDYYTAQTGADNSWNLYRVLGHRSGAMLDWWNAHQAATNMIFEGVAGHLVKIENSTENMLCQSLRNFGHSDCWIGLTDNEFMTGAHESGNTIDEPNVEVRRTNGWVWVTGEPLDATQYINWDSGEPNNAPSEDAVIIRTSGLWSDLGSGIPDSGDNVYERASIVEWELNSPLPIEGATIIDPILPPSEELPGADLKVDGSFVGVWMRASGLIDNIYTASRLFNSGTGTTILTNQNINTINFSDPDRDVFYAGPIFRRKQGYFANLSGTIDTHWVALYRGKFVIPEGGEGLYTFGAHVLSGFALRLTGNTWSSVHGNGGFDVGSLQRDTIYCDNSTQDTDTRGIVYLAAGVHEIEFLTYNTANASQYHELYAAKGAFTNDTDTTNWRLVGHQSIGSYTFVGLTSQWDVWHSTTGATTMDQASTTMSALAGGSVNHTLWDEINFYDPERGGPHEAMLPGGAPFPYNTPADDNSKLIFALGTLNIPRDMSIGFGFDSDDGTRLTVSNQTWNSVLYARNTANLSIFNDNFQFDINGFVACDIELSAGAHKLGVLHREANGDAYIDVYQISMEAYDGQLPFPLTYRTISPTSAEIVQDIDGLQLYKRSNMLLLIR